MELSFSRPQMTNARSDLNKCNRYAHEQLSETLRAFINQVAQQEPYMVACGDCLWAALTRQCGQKLDITSDVKQGCISRFTSLCKEIVNYIYSKLLVS